MDIRLFSLLKIAGYLREFTVRLRELENTEESETSRIRTRRNYYGFRK